MRILISSCKGCILKVLSILDRKGYPFSVSYGKDHDTRISIPEVCYSEEKEMTFEQFENEMNKKRKTNDKQND